MGVTPSRKIFHNIINVVAVAEADGAVPVVFYHDVLVAVVFPDAWRLSYLHDALPVVQDELQADGVQRHGVLHPE